MTPTTEELTRVGTDGIRRSLGEHYDTIMDVRQDPTGAHMAIQALAARVVALEEAVKAALQVKPLVWTHHPMGLMASTGFGNAYIIDTRDSPRVRWGKWPGGHGPERETLAEMQYAAQADYEARIIAALKGGEV